MSQSVTECNRPPLHPIGSLAPHHLNQWADTQTNGMQLDLAHLAGERDVCAFWYGPQELDPKSTASMNPGWIRDMQEHTQAHMDVLHDINDLVSHVSYLL